MTTNDGLIPDWPAPASVGAVVTTRLGGHSVGAYGLVGGAPGGLNLALHVGDDPATVARNRGKLPANIQWLQQVHGTTVVCVDALDAAIVPSADAAYATRPGKICAVLTADCLPVLLTDRQGTIVAAAHAGWRGLCGGVLDQLIASLRNQRPDAEWLAYLGPAIGPMAFEIGPEVRDAFLAQRFDASAFRPGHAGRWFADLPALARQRLYRLGVNAVFGGSHCTVADAERFYSYRRDGMTGRMATLIWLTHGAE